MTCQLIQTRRLDDANLAEREMLDFLRNLPEEYFVYRELQLTPAYRDRMRGMQKKQPDFVVVGPGAGVLAIEVKDWNLDYNVYEWQDQHTVLKITAGGRVSEIDNPMLQADTYLHALMELLRDTHVFVSSVVAFPRLSRSVFLNRIKNVDVFRNPQMRFYLDLERILFREDLDEHRPAPEKLLEAVVSRNPNFFTSRDAALEGVHRRLMPSSFIVGDYTERQRARERLQVLTEQQQRWIFNLDPRKNYLLDVAGSGKTNVLISKAIHLIDLAESEGRSVPRVLLTTYSPNLERNIRRIFWHKIAASPRQQLYRDAIVVQCIPNLMESIVLQFFGVTDVAEYRRPGESPAEYEGRLKDDVLQILEDAPEKFARFDYVFVDEIQDFDNSFLFVVRQLCKGRNFFFVGDMGQKIYERQYNLNRVGIVTARAELESSYKMFRTPRHIAMLATRFVLGDPMLRQEFREHGYSEEFTYPKNLSTLAEILRADDPEGEVAERVRSLLNGGYTEGDLMIVTSLKRMPRMAEALERVRVRYVLEETEDAQAITVTDFMNVKGLEKEVVLVTGIEDLYEHSKPEAMFDELDTRYACERFSRRKIYVSLTRPLEQLIIYYQDAGNRFVAELLTINREIQHNRMGA
jgi:hypothetical protein